MDGRQTESVLGPVERAGERLIGQAPEPTEDQVTKGIERYTAAVPSSAFLAVALGAIGVSLGLQLAGRGQWGNFVASWVPTWLIFGLYNKLVKLEGHDRQDRGGQRSGERAATGISNRPLHEERERQEHHLPPRGTASLG